jgi:hypothetical protein
LSRFELAGNVDGQRVYTAIVNSPTFKCMLRIVYVVREEKGKIYTALLFSTDISLVEKPAVLKSLTMLSV